MVPNNVKQEDKSMGFDEVGSNTGNVSMSLSLLYQSLGSFYLSKSAPKDLVLNKLLCGIIGILLSSTTTLL